ncbi:MAG: 2-C-methyl-D-erythritol 4-phosphate cytidylyltransferase [Phascolarctobacterium sp.]|uniref:2-C-methyl-D-erythritol 4-phosphate cytidylyltransferase n=1 Tax=Phascolarctobacterium sp. TaxID=2049039 RepID=UPI0026DABDDB|nr:2-C-methyl-D-erythritol 4-phosphate cytidylyltransferase [Phascolarctobacterium sp.]MDO4920368.1 2-C-methyl-D-erythritol 4-phosphate cytidylyltransferase [Phascolarctobacterium sp.]
MNIAIIFAGGTGQRMNTASKPKQFLELHGKPILIYTLEHFQKHEQIDGIILVCLENYIAYCKNLLVKWQISKVAEIVSGGTSGQESIFHGLQAAHKLYADSDIVLIHDGVRPLINEQVITDAIICTKQYDNAITVSPAIETVVIKQESGHIGDILNRSVCELAKAPQCFYLKDIYEAHLKANEEGRHDFIDSASIMQYYGYTLNTVIGPTENIKITTPSDFYTFRAIIDARENMQILGL